MKTFGKKILSLKNWDKNSRQWMGEMEAVNETFLRWKILGEKFQDGKLVQKPRIRKNLGHKIGMKNYFVGKIEKVVFVD